jgi:uncharacterized protein
MSTATATPTITPTHRILNWFEIPVLDMARASRCYGTLLGIELRAEQMGPQQLAVFPYADGATGGCLLAGPQVPQPSQNGCVVYLNAGEVLATVVARIEAAGATLLTPRVDLPGDMGAFVHIVDSEGNRVGLHALR